MSNLVIVAIPEDMDRVWKLSSEKVPHLTLLFLGEMDTNPHVESIVQFVEHAVTLSEHGPFYLDVDHRGTLGSDDADVLFFSKRSWNLKWISQFRGQLLQNEQIRSAYDSTQQYGAPQEWTPHLTMGYPTAPAKEPSNDGFDHPIYSVCFDRIAVWVDNFDGPDFRLEWPDRPLEGEMAVAYSDEQKKSLMHYGKKGMKWGVRTAADIAPIVSRRSRDAETTLDIGSKVVSKINEHKGRKTETVTVGSKTKKVTPKKAAKLDKKFEKKVTSSNTFVQIHNAAADHVNAKIGGFNASFEKKHPKEMNDGTLLNDHHPVTKEYHAAYNKLMLEGLNAGAAKLGTNPTGTRRVKIVSENHDSLSEFGWAPKTEKVKHAATEAPTVFLVKRDSNGIITSTEPVEDSMAQATERGKEFVVKHQSVLDNATLSEQIKAKIQSILDDVTGDNKDVSLFGDPLIRTKLKSVLDDFYKDPNVDNAVVYDALGEAFLEHYGKKGMRWGFRKGSIPEAAAPVASSKIPAGNRRKTKIETEGGQNHPAHEDAIKVAEAKTKLKKSGPAALSNKELRDVANRVQLENQVKLLTSRKGKQFVTRQLRSEGENLLRTGIREGAKKGAKRAGVAALA